MRQRGHLARVVDREDEVRRVAGRAARVRQRALVEQHQVAPAEPRQVVDEAVADDAGADHDGAGAARQTPSSSLVFHGAHLGVRNRRIPDISHPNALVIRVAKRDRSRSRSAAGRVGVGRPVRGLRRSRTGSGVVVRRPCGAVGASALICATITAFYDIQRARGDDFFVYPDYFLFHVGGAAWATTRGSTSSRAARRWSWGTSPRRCSRRSTIAAITRLVVEDGDAAAARAATRAELASARGRIVTCLAYSPSGRVRTRDVRIAGNDITEGYVEAILDPESRMERLRRGDEADRASRGRDRRARGRGAAPSCARRSPRRAPSSSRTAARSRPTAASAWTRRSRCCEAARCPAARSTPAGPGPASA